MGSFVQNLGGGYLGNDPRKIASSQRNYIQNYGDWMNAQNQLQGGLAQGQNNYYQQILDNSLDPMAAGAGGYNPVEAGQIQGLYGQGGIPGLTDINTPQSTLQQNFLTPDEQAAIAGNPNYGGYFDPTGMSGAQDTSAGLQRGAIQGLQQGLDQSINPAALSQSQGYLDQTGQTLAQNRGNTMATMYGEAGNVRGALGGEQGTVRGDIAGAPLQQSADAAQQIKMTPQQQQDIVTGAGISAGIRNQAAVGDLMRQTAAAGGSPQAVAAYRERMGVESAAEASDAMTQARIQASNAAAQRAYESEAQRLGAQQYLTGAQTGTELAMGQQQTGAEMAMGQQAMQAQQALGAQQLGQQNLQEQQRLGAQQYLTGAQLQAATTGGEAAIGGEQAINAQQRQQGQFNTQMGTGILQSQDQAAAARAQALAQNRQGIGMYNAGQQYQQGLTANQLASQRGAQVANTRLGQQQFGLGMYGGLQTQANQNQQNAYNRQQQTFGTTAGATNQAAGMGLQASQYPTGLEKAAGGVLGALGAAAPFMDDGGVVTQPSLRVVGESGPEWIGPAAKAAGAGLGWGQNPYGQMGAGVGKLLGNYFDYRQKKAQQKYGNKAQSDAVNAMIDAPGNTAPRGVGRVGESDYQMMPASVRSALGIGGGLPEYLNEGTVVDKPTLAVLAEHGQPEAVVPLGNRPDAKVRPSVAFGKENVRRRRPPMYAEG